MRPTATIEEKKHSSRQAEKILVDAFKNQGGKLTKADAIARSGLPQQEVEPALEVLLKEYKSHLEVTEKGELLYEFDSSFERRDAVPFSERLGALGRWLWKGFMAGFKLWILLTIVVYVILYVVILVAMLVAQSQGGDSRGGRSSRSSDGFGDGLFWYFLFNPWRPAPANVNRGRYGRPAKKKFMEAVYDFCFGPPHPTVDPLGDEKRILAFIRRQRGRITASDLVALTGWSYDKCQQEVTRLLVDYGGDPEVTEDGTIVYVFKDLRVTAESAAADPERRAAARGALESTGEPVYFWQQADPKELLTGNTGGQNALIGALSAFNLLGALFLGNVGLVMLQQWARVKEHVILGAGALATAKFWIITFPLLFTIIFLGVPLVRTIGVARRERKRKARNRRRRLLQTVYEVDGKSVPPEVLVDRAMARARAEEVGDRAHMLAELDAMLVPYEGTVENDPQSGKVVYRFPRLEQEVAGAATVRALASSDEARAGDVVFDTDK